MPSLITFSPNTVIKSADVNTNFSSLNNSIGSITSLQNMLTVPPGGTEVDGYYLGFVGNNGYLGAAWVQTISHGSTPVSVGLDESTHSHANCAAIQSAFLNSYGCEVFSHGNSSGNVDANVGGIATFHF